MATYDQYMAGSGQQSTLDELRRTGQYDAARSAWEGGGTSSFDSYYNTAKGEIEKYIGELENITNGDYDFIARWLESNYKEAVGNDDGARQQIIKEVANDLEKRVGRLGYDYQTGKYRIEQDAQTQTTRLNENTTTALNRLKADEQQLKAEWEMKAKETRQNEAGNLNARGILNSTRDAATGLAGSVVRNTEQGLGLSWDALQRSVNQQREDTLLNQSRGLTDISLQKDRGIQDLGTSTRRGYEDQSNTYNYQLQSAQREKERKLAELKRQKSESLWAAKNYAESASRVSSGAY